MNNIKRSFWTLVVCLLAMSLEVLAQDQIKKSDGNLIKVKILKIEPEEVTYQTYINPTGPVYKLRLKLVDWIKVDGEPDTIRYAHDKVRVLFPVKLADDQVIPDDKLYEVDTTEQGQPKQIPIAKTAADSALAYRNIFTNDLVMLPTDKQPKLKELIITVGGGANWAQDNGHPFGDFGIGKNANFYQKGGALFATQGGYFELGALARFSKRWGGFINYVYATNGFDGQNLMNSDYTSPLALPPNSAGGPLSKSLTAVEVSNNFMNMFVTGGPTFYQTLSRRTDLIVHSGLGLGSIFMPNFKLAYQDKISGNAQTLTPARPYTEVYQPINSNILGVAYSLGVRVKTYIRSGVYAIGKIGYDGQATNVTFQRTDNVFGGGRTTNYSAYHNYNNLVFGAAIGLGL
jgi:hypothetical protein